MRIYLLIYEGAKYVFNLIKEKAEKELHDYIKQNLSNYDIYVKNNNGFINFNYYNLGIGPAVTIHPSMEFINLLECTVRLETDFNHSIIEYDLLKDKVISCKSRYSDRDIPLMNAFFKPKLELAYEQYKKGIAPSLYTEIAKLRQFIAGK